MKGDRLAGEVVLSVEDVALEARELGLWIGSCDPNDQPRWLACLSFIESLPLLSW